MNNISGIKDVEVGNVYQTREGGSVTILLIRNYNDIVVEHNDEYKHQVVTRLSHINSGSIRNPYKPSVYGIGYIGVGPYKSCNDGRKTVEYDAWNHMFTRCYSNVYQDKNPSYVGCTVDPIWHNFQNFAHWYCYTGYYNIGYHLDKDLLVQGNRIYSPNTCTMLPAELNSTLQVKETDRLLPTGVLKTNSGYKAQFNNLSEKAYLGTFNTIEEAHQQYRLAKKRQLIKLAIKYEGRISMVAYQALLKTILNT